MIEAGKYYRLRNGSKAFVVSKDIYRPEMAEATKVAPLKGEHLKDGKWCGGVRWTERGRFRNYPSQCRVENDLDIVGEWKEPASATQTLYLVDVMGGPFPGHKIVTHPYGNKVLGTVDVTITEGQGMPSALEERSSGGMGDW